MNKLHALLDYLTAPEPMAHEDWEYAGQWGFAVRITSLLVVAIVLTLYWLGANP